MRNCKKCNLPKDEEKGFYGNQTECKLCTRQRVRNREAILKLNPEWMEKERNRHRDKYHRLNYREKHKPSPEKKKAIMDSYKLRYPEKYKAKNISQDLKPLIKGQEQHHWNYNVEFAKDIFWLFPKDHAKIHRFIKYDKTTFMYKDLNGDLLDTKEKHDAIIIKVLSNF